MASSFPPTVDRRWRWLAWYLFVVVWTALLVVPDPTPPITLIEANLTLKVVIAKTVHVVAYAVFAILSGWLSVAVRFRALLVLFLAAHAAATELVQTEFSGRTGLVSDVLLDHVGIGLGIGLSWKWWSHA